LSESLPSSRVTSSKIIEMDNDILVFDTIKEEDVITSVLNKLSNNNTHSKMKTVTKIRNKIKAVLITYKIGKQYRSF
jgi:hypothetical protein